MQFEAIDQDLKVLEQWQVYSTGGGALRQDGETSETPIIYKMNSARDIIKYCTPKWPEFLGICGRE